MNIKQAKEQIRQTVDAYRQKNEFGEYLIPVERQRPLFLLGAPGIGKTAVMRQVAQELGIGLVSTSMAHHTLQTALGQPVVSRKTCRGQEYQAAEYAMSEIIAPVCEQIEKHNLQEGILFLDEINCVPDALLPALLQFLQYKVFGRHRVPDGWIIVTAGGPAEFNASARSFDVATRDRLKKISVEPDYGAWKEYAAANSVHPAVLSYLELHPDHFCRLDPGAGETDFVTPRGWVELSDLVTLYEKLNHPVSGQLVGQYLQDAEIADSFADYYPLFLKFRTDYPIDEILDRKQSAAVEMQAEKLKGDGRTILLNILLADVCADMKKVVARRDMMKILMDEILGMKKDFSGDTAGDGTQLLEKAADRLRRTAAERKQAGVMPEEEAAAMLSAAQALSRMQQTVRRESPKTSAASFELIKKEFEGENAQLRSMAEAAGRKLENMFCFCEKVFPDSKEISTLADELKLRPCAVRFIARYGSALDESVRTVLRDFLPPETNQ